MVYQGEILSEKHMYCTDKDLTGNFEKQKNVQV
jgi:hypothetical protein